MSNQQYGKDNYDDAALTGVDTTGRDLNKDPITGAPGSHPVGVGVGGVAGGAAAGAIAGSFLGPIGTLIGAAAGVVVGSAVGKVAAESIDPTGEVEYWRGEHANRPYVAANAEKDYEFDRDYAAAYGFGLQGREKYAGRTWEDTESSLKEDWNSARGTSRLEWNEARDAAKDSWDRADRTYRTYDASDSYSMGRFDEADYKTDEDSYDDYRPAYRYGTYARTRHEGRDWDDRLESELKQDWDKTKGESKLTWERAKSAVRDTFENHDSYARGNDRQRDTSGL